MQSTEKSSRWNGFKSKHALDILQERHDAALWKRGWDALETGWHSHNYDTVDCRTPYRGSQGASCSTWLCLTWMRALGTTSGRSWRSQGHQGLWPINVEKLRCSLGFWLDCISAFQPWLDKGSHIEHGWPGKAEIEDPPWELPPRAHRKRRVLDYEDNQIRNVCMWER